MRKELKIGLMGIAALVIFFFGIKFLKGSSLFNSTNIYHIDFKNAKGLTKSSSVFADGFNIGIVSDIAYTRPGQVIVSIDVNSGVKIPHGTIVQLNEGMLGGCTLNMTMGANPANCYAPGDTLKGSDSNGLMDAAAKLMPQADRMLAHVDSLVMALNKLANNPNLPVILENARAITENLDKSSAQLNTLLVKDIPALTSSLQRSSNNLDVVTGNLAQADLNATVNKLNETVQNLNDATQKLKSKDNNVGLLLNDTTLYSNLNNSVNSIQLLLEDIKKHPGRYVNISVFGRKQKD